MYYIIILYYIVSYCITLYQIILCVSCFILFYIYGLLSIAMSNTKGSVNPAQAPAIPAAWCSQRRFQGTTSLMAPATNLGGRHPANHPSGPGKLCGWWFTHEGPERKAMWEIAEKKSKSSNCGDVMMSSIKIGFGDVSVKEKISMYRHFFSQNPLWYGHGSNPC